MTSITVIVLFGKQKIDVDLAPTDNLSILRRNVEERLGLVDGGVRLIHKGKTITDGSTAQSTGLSAGTKVMAIRTAKQMKANQEQEKLIKQRSLSMPSATATTDASKAPSSDVHSTHTDSKVNDIKGDEKTEGFRSIIIQKGRDLFRINLTDEITAVRHVKEQLGKIAVVDARDVRLIRGGKFLRDDDSLDGIPDNSKIMAMFTARHHDRVEARSELENLTKEVEALENEGAKLMKQAERRLIPQDELAFVRSQFSQDVKRVQDNIGAIRENEKQRAELEKRLDKLEEDFTSF